MKNSSLIIKLWKEQEEDDRKIFEEFKNRVAK